MTMKKYKKGKHTYTELGKGIKEVKKVSEAKPKPQQQQLQIKMDEETAMGKYSNLGSVAHTNEEFVIDFIYLPPGPPGATPAKVVSRIITSPGHAKRLYMALADNLTKFEAKFGEITPSKGPETKIGFN
jgi:hypothetical protein